MRMRKVVWRLFLPVIVFHLTLGLGESVAREAPEVTSTVLKRVQGQFAERRFSDAIKILDQALEDNPGDFHLWVALGYSWQELGEKANAISAFKRAVEIRPEADRVRERISLLEGSGVKLPSVTNEVPVGAHKSREWFSDAKKLRASGKIAESLRLFIECVEDDRLFLAYDDGFINLGLNHFRQRVSEGHSTETPYLAIFSAFHGDYDSAYQMLEEFISKHPDPETGGVAGRFMKIILEFRNRERELLAAAKKLHEGENVESPKRQEAKPFTGKKSGRADGSVEAKQTRAAGSAVSGQQSFPTFTQNNDEQLVHELESTDSQVVRRAIWQIGVKRLHSDKIVAAISQKLLDPDPEIRLATINAIGKLGPDAVAAAPLLLDLAKNGVPIERVRSLIVLAMFSLLPMSIFRMFLRSI